MSMLRLRLVRKVNRASASVFVGNMRSDWKLERSLSNIGPGPCIGVCCVRNWKNAPTSAQSDTKKGARSTRTSLALSRPLATRHASATPRPHPHPPAPPPPPPRPPPPPPAPPPPPPRP